MRTSILFIKIFFTFLLSFTPIWGSLAITISVLGIFVGHLEGLNWREGLYFGWVTATTVGYGDITPTLSLSRILSIFIGIIGIVSTGLIVSIAVTAGKNTLKRTDLVAEAQKKIEENLRNTE